MKMKKLALICHRNYKIPFILEAAQAVGIELVLVCDTLETVPESVQKTVLVWKLPVFDKPDEALLQFADEATKYGIGGVMTLREEAVMWTARAAIKIGTPGIPLRTAELVRDKYLMRKAFAASGMRTPRFACIQHPDDISAATVLGFPLVIKPLSGWGSTGVMLAHTERELSELLHAVWKVQHQDLSRFYHGKNPAGLVVEHYLPGREFVVECFVDNAGVHVLAVGEKGQPQGPWFEETIYRQIIEMDSPLVRDLCDAAHAGVKALGITMGAAHVELRLDGHHQPYVIEIGARIGGSGVSHFIVEQGTGISFAQLCMQSALGLPTPALPDILPVKKVAANYIIPLRGHGRFSGFSGIEAVAEHKGTTKIIIFFEQGHCSPPPPAFGGYPGFIFSVHNSLQDAKNYHQWLDDSLNIIWK